MDEKTPTCGIDVGVTSTKIGIVSESLEMLEFTSIPTERNSEEKFVVAVAGAVATLKRKAGIPTLSEAGVGVPGFVDPTGRIVISTVQTVPFMENCRLGERLSAVLDLPVAVDNDARMHAVGEYLSCRKRPRSMVALTLGTGLGMAWIVDGALFPPPDHGAMGGHAALGPESYRCYCGVPGCAESHLSVTALLEKAERALQKNAASLLYKIRDGLKAEDILRLHATDSVARGLVNELIGHLKRYLQIIFHSLFPDLISLSGGLAVGLRPWQEELQTSLDVLLRYDGKSTRLRMSGLGTASGVLGASQLGVWKRKEGKV